MNKAGGSEKEPVNEKSRTVQAAPPAPAGPGGQERPGPHGPREQRRGRGGQRRRAPRPQKDSEFAEKVVAVNRVAKVVKGGKNFSFSALVVVGDTKGRVGFAIGKAREVQDAIKKGIQRAKDSMFRVPMKGTTIPHEIIGKFGAARVLLKPASQGTGVISGAAVRAVCECAGIKDILTKSFRSQTPINVVRATASGLQSMITSAD